MPTTEEIEKYLELVRLFIVEDKVDFIKGSDEKYTLGKLGISITDAFEMVKDLDVKNYYRGPSPDHRYPSQQVWEFGIPEIFEDEIPPHRDLYVKLTFRNTRGDLLMMSFHKARDLITYPYK
ncbi:hypothetical protein Dred_0029 [Desulforamulus reducens MI-1]|uniref:Toxin n=1 Tax=Desulforamulus reducens (strain ATCC BAA-1160 / DSM 100696 / MI-1) TaxID=349161 RepID=A4J0H6_DESRM|nr:type II toxin-antitoxin system MqsR family toxin [Desulforamulus reducens]ABO48579.1 hypothetical protein Dred_0029 [Desulforamulus reducens MI-1]